MNQPRRSGSAPDADLFADAGDYPEIDALLAELRDLGQGPIPEPSPELAAFFKPKVVPLRRKRRGTVIGVVVAASMSLGMGAVAANEEVRENLYAAVDTTVELVQPDKPDQLRNQANDGGASDGALPAVPPVVTKPGGIEIPAEAGHRVYRSGGPLEAVSTREPDSQGSQGSQGSAEAADGAAGGARSGGQPRAASAVPAPPAAPAGKASTGKTSVGKGQSAGQANETANGKANGKPKADKSKVSEAARNVARNAGKAQQPVKRLVRRAVEGAPPINRGLDKLPSKQAEDKPRGATEKRSGPVKKIVEKGVDPTVERLGRTLGKAAGRD